MTITMMVSAVAHGAVSGCILLLLLATSSPTEKRGQRNAGPFLKVICAVRDVIADVIKTAHLKLSNQDYNSCVRGERN